jgi:hypothetical protein
MGERPDPRDDAVRCPLGVRVVRRSAATEERPHETLGTVPWLIGLLTPSTAFRFPWARPARRSQAPRDAGRDGGDAILVASRTQVQRGGETQRFLWSAPWGRPFRFARNCQRRRRRGTCQRENVAEWRFAGF